MGSSQYLSQIMKSVSDIIKKDNLTGEDLSNLHMYISSWDGIQSVQEKMIAKESGIPYFFVYTLNRGLYNILTSFWSRPYTARPSFMNKISHILEILGQININWEKILDILRSTGGGPATEQQQLTVSKHFDEIFKIISGQSGYYLQTQFRELHDEVKGITLSDIENLSNNQALFNNIPFDTTKNTFGVHIAWIDNIVKSWEAFARGQQEKKEKQGVEAAFQTWMTDPTVSYEATEKINNYYLYGKDYHPDHIMAWQGPTATAAKGGLNKNQWNTHLDPTIDQVVLIPQQILGKDYHNFSPDMKLLIIAILQISDWSIRTGTYVDEAMVNTGENAEMRQIRSQQSSADQVKLQFKNDLRRYFLSFKNFEKFGPTKYENVGEQMDRINSPLGLQKMVKRMELLKQGQEKIDIARKSTNTWENDEWNMVASIVARIDDRMATMGGKRKRRRRKTRRRKKKTKRRKKTRRKKRTKKRKKKKKKRKKTKRKRK